MVTILLYQGLWSLCSLWYWRLHQPSSCMTPLNKHWPIFHSLVYSQQSRNKTLISRSFLILEIPSIVDLFHEVHLMKSYHFLWLFSPSSFFAVTVFLNQNVSHYISFLTNKRFLFIKSNQFRSTNSRNTINDSYIGYDKFLPEQFILYKRIVKVDLFAMYCLLRLQLPNRSQLMQQYMNHKTHPEMMSSTLVKWCIHPLFLPAIITESDG